MIQLVVKGVWVGGKYDETARSFTWTTGETWNVETWDAWEPDDPFNPNGNDCVRIDDEIGKFDQESCDELWGILCESTG